MAEQNKQDLLVDLYALRAGLSEISLRKDVIVGQEQKRKSLSENLKEDEKSLKKRTKKNNKQLNEYEQELSGMDENCERLRKFIKSNGALAILWSFLLILAIALTALCVYLMVMRTMWFVLAAFVCFVGVVVCFLMAKDHLESWYNHKRDLKQLPERKKRLERNLNLLQNGMNDLREQEMKYRANIEKQEKTICSLAQDVSRNIGFCMAMYQTLYNSFGTLLDPRDWKNLDLVIFYLETGRADSVKEALQLADRQAQTDQIVGAIRSAGVMISDTIKSGMREMQINMVKCFSVLSDRMDAIAERQMGAIAGLSAQVSSFSKSLEAKANVPSAQLAEDMHYIRTLAENEEVRRRNGM